MTRIKTLKVTLLIMVFLLNKNDIIKNIPNRIKFDFSYLLKVLIKKN